jgi:hypothetical protein
MMRTDLSHSRLSMLLPSAIYADMPGKAAKKSASRWKPRLSLCDLAMMPPSWQS